MRTLAQDKEMKPMARDYEAELKKRIKFIKNQIRNAHCTGIVFGNSGGKDSALVGILCKKACTNTVGIIMPCASKRNYGMDADDGRELAEKFDIETRTVDLTPARDALVKEIEKITKPSTLALANIAPRLRMNALYSIAASEGRLVAGTGNRSELYMGYFTKWGDGAFDFNPIGDLTVTEVYEFLEYLGCPESIIKKAPSAALFEGQTDEAEMGISYADIDKYLFTGEATESNLKILNSYHDRSEHKRKMPTIFTEE